MLKIQFLEDLVLRFGGLKNSFYLCIRNSGTGCSGVSAEKVSGIFGRMENRLYLCKTNR